MQGPRGIRPLPCRQSRAEMMRLAVQVRTDRAFVTYRAKETGFMRGLSLVFLIAHVRCERETEMEN